MFDSGVTLLGEISWKSLLGIKGLGGFGEKKKLPTDVLLLLHKLHVTSKSFSTMSFACALI